MTNKVTALEFSDRCDRLRSAIASLVSCRKGEIEGESRVMLDAVYALRDLTLVRRNPILEARRDDLIAYAYERFSDREEARLRA